MSCVMNTPDKSLNYEQPIPFTNKQDTYYLLTIFNTIPVKKYWLNWKNNNYEWKSAFLQIQRFCDLQGWVSRIHFKTLFSMAIPFVSLINNKGTIFINSICIRTCFAVLIANYLSLNWILSVKMQYRHVYWF